MKDYTLPPRLEDTSTPNALRYLRSILRGGDIVYTIGTMNNGWYVLITRCASNDVEHPFISDITPSVAKVIRRRLNSAGAIPPTSGTGYNHAAEIIENLAHVIFPETPDMENLRHGSL